MVVALLVVGLNPAIALDDDYNAFLDAIAAHITTAMVNTRIQQTEKALTVSKGRLRSFVESNVIGILFGDVYEAIHEANDEFLRIVGYSREDLNSGQLRWTDLTPPEYLPLDEKSIAEAQARGACTPYEKEYFRKDGSRVPVLLGYSLLGEAREESVAFILDISARKKVEQSLRQKEAELRLVTDMLPVLISFVDADQRYRFNNKGYEDWFECSAGDLYGKHIREVHGESAYAVLLPYVEQVLSGQSVTFEKQVFRKKDGKSRYFSATYVPRLDETGAVEGFVGLVTDITERKTIEIEREHLLEREHDAREAAETANRIKDEFLAVISHELRTPLNPILGWTQMLQRGKLSEEKKAFAIQTIERNAKLQVQLIGDLLDISRVLRGKMNVAKDPVDLSSVILAAVETVRLAAERKSVALETNLSPCMVIGDAGRLQQIVWNLLSNAVKFTPDSGGVTVTLQAVEHRAQIQVADTGKGIAADFLPHVFEHFRQEDYSTTRQFGGLGLGLAIARQLVELHGGTIAVDSLGVDQGSTFTVKLPLASQTNRPTMAPLNAAEPGKSFNGLKILVVDDEVDSLEITAFALEQTGASVTSVNSGAAALSAFEQTVPDVIVSDIAMPGMDGYTLMKKIRQLPPDAGGKVLAIALTAYAGELDFRQALAAGFQRHVAKPVDPAQLAEIIGELRRDLPNDPA